MPLLGKRTGQLLGADNALMHQLATQPQPAHTCSERGVKLGLSDSLLRQKYFTQRPARPSLLAQAGELMTGFIPSHAPGVARGQHLPQGSPVGHEINQVAPEQPGHREQAFDESVVTADKNDSLHHAVEHEKEVDNQQPIEQGISLENRQKFITAGYNQAVSPDGYQLQRQQHGQKACEISNEAFAVTPQKIIHHRAACPPMSTKPLVNNADDPA